MFFSLSLSASELFPNLKEGKISAYDFEVQDSIYKFIQDIPLGNVADLNRQFLIKKKRFCPIEYLEFLNKEIKLVLSRSQNNEMKVRAYLKYQRSLGFMDDFVYSRLMKLTKGLDLVIKDKNTDGQDRRYRNLRYSYIKDELNSIHSKKRPCQFDLYKGLIEFVIEKYGSHDKYFLLRTFAELEQGNFISMQTYVWVSTLLSSDIFKDQMTLTEYIKKLKAVIYRSKLKNKSETNFYRELRNKSQKTRLFGLIKGEKPESLRISIYEKYDHYHMYLMSKLIKDLLKRLNSEKIEIVVKNSEGTILDHSFSPTQHFRYAIWKLDESITSLEQHTHFYGKKISPFELIAVGYELDVLNSNELEGAIGIINILDPEKKNQEDWRLASESILAAAPIVFPEYAVGVLMSSLLFKKYFPPEEEEPGYLRVF